MTDLILAQDSIARGSLLIPFARRSRPAGSMPCGYATAAPRIRPAKLY
ncbi:hypothetical protein PBOI14_46280 [Pseudomonas sp. Boi14]|nr:hypothetical protein PBOI14_46280 [Pseudomonas sp. Boi14]